MDDFDLEVETKYAVLDLLENNYETWERYRHHCGEFGACGLVKSPNGRTWFFPGLNIQFHLHWEFWHRTVVVYHGSPTSREAYFVEIDRVPKPLVKQAIEVGKARWEAKRATQIRGSINRFLSSNS